MKTLQKTIAAVALATLLFSSNLFAQSANAEVKISLKKALAISNPGASDVDFGEVLLAGSVLTPSVDPENGANFVVTGHPNRDVAITFGTASITNNAWNTLMGGGTNDAITFTPDVEETSNEPVYGSGSPATVTSGDTETLANITGTGTLYLWIGGELAVADDQEHGDYTGTFTLTVAYN